MSYKSHVQKKMSYKSLEEGGCTQTDEFSEISKPEGIASFLVGFGMLFGLGYVVFLVFGSTPPIEFNMTEASITQFNITSNNILYYNFNVSITITNLENKVRSFERVDAISSYKGNQLNLVTLVPFSLGSKNTVRLQPIVFEGNSLIKLDRQQLVEYIKETQSRIYNLHFELSKYMGCARVRIPMISNGNLAPTFEVVKCSYKW